MKRNILYLLIGGCTDSRPSTNKWGKNPKGRE